LKIKLAEKETNFIMVVEGPHVFKIWGWNPNVSTYFHGSNFSSFEVLM
jgi:hypothetical protein